MRQRRWELGFVYYPCISVVQSATVMVPDELDLGFLWLARTVPQPELLESDRRLSLHRPPIHCCTTKHLSFQRLGDSSIREKLRTAVDSCIM